ncbi:MAG: hypothetical protein PHU25_11530 [Deltaproteobacteria bacterium]|nr:hypothetical protein [Deltaproteobacteria bacterium]
MSPMRSTALVAAITTLAVSATGCGPSCTEVMTSKTDKEVLAGDVARVNEFVARRKAAMAEAEKGGHDTFAMERLKFSVTACELAIQVGLRIIKLSPTNESSDLYRENVALINEVRCGLDELLEKEGYLFSDGAGDTIQTYHARFRKVFRSEGESSDLEVKTYSSQGIASGRSGGSQSAIEGSSGK